MGRPLTGAAKLFAERALSEWDRFMLYVKPGRRARPELEPCWMWTGARTSSGHGSFRMYWSSSSERELWAHTSTALKKSISAHKMSYLHHFGPVPKDDMGRDLHIRHLCDVRLCVNPNHLIPGDRSENMRDMIERNRGRMQFGTPERLQIPEESEECPF